MNICQVLVSDGWGGAESWLYEIVRSLRDKGENVSMILNQEMIKYYVNLENISLFNIGTLYPPKSIIPHIRADRIKPALLRQALSLFYHYLDEHLRYQQFKWVKREVMEFLSVNSVQIIQAHMPLATIFTSNLRELEIPIIASEHGDYALRGIVPVHPLDRPLTNWRARKYSQALNKADKVHLVSNFLLKAVEDRGIPLKGKPLVIPVGINVSEVQGSSGSTMKLKGKFNLLFPGGAKWAKGGDLLVSALAQVKQEMPNIHLYIAHNVPQDHMLRKMVAELRLEQNVTFTGFLSVPEYRSLVKSVDLFVMPSRIEAFPLAILEAMALGKPIVAANVGGIPEQIKNYRNGILVELDPEHIARAILYLHENNSLRTEISQNNLKEIARFDSSSLVDQYIRFYRDALNVNQSESL